MKPETNNCRVYFHRRESDDKIFYVGKGCSDRPYRKNGRNPYWHNVVRKHGYYVEIVKDWSPIICCNTYEKILINIIGRENLCNLTDGGEGAPGMRHSLKTRELISQKQKKIWQNDEYKNSRTGPNHHFYGNSHPKETREKLSNAMKGRYFSYDHRKKIGEAHAGEKNYFWGKKLSQEHKDKISASISGENHPLYGLPVSEETKNKIRESLRGRKHRPETIEKIKASLTGRISSHETRKRISEGKKKTDIYTFTHQNGETYTGIRFDFINKYGLDPSDITRLITGKAKSSKGWRLS